MGRLNRRLGIPEKEEPRRELTEEEKAYMMAMQQQEQAEQEYLNRIRQQKEEEEEDEEEDEYESYKDVPIKKAIDIKRDPTPKGYFPTIISGVPVDLHALEEYIVKTSPFAIKTLLRYDNARNIEDIKNYSTKTSGKKKMDAKFFILIILAIFLLVGGVVVMLFMPDIIAMFQGMGP